MAGSPPFDSTFLGLPAPTAARGCARGVNGLKPLACFVCRFAISFQGGPSACPADGVRYINLPDVTRLYSLMFYGSFSGALCPSWKLRFPVGLMG